MKGSLFLVVEDDADIRDVVTEVLREHGCEVHQARGGNEALRTLRGGLRPDLVLLDWVMPDGSGAQFVEAVQSDPELRGLRIVLMTASKAAPQAIPNGCVGVLSKPFDLSELDRLTDCVPPKNPGSN